MPLLLKKKKNACNPTDVWNIKRTQRFSHNVSASEETELDDEPTKSEILTSQEIVCCLFLTKFSAATGIISLYTYSFFIALYLCEWF